MQLESAVVQRVRQEEHLAAEALVQVEYDSPLLRIDGFRALHLLPHPVYQPILDFHEPRPYLLVGGDERVVGLLLVIVLPLEFPLDPLDAGLEPLLVGEDQDARDNRGNERAPKQIRHGDAR